MADPVFGALAPGGDELLPPPRNPLAPPDAIVNALRSAIQHNADWASVPARIYQGVQPETPGQWSEEDQFRANHLANQPYQFGPQTAFSEVFWPRTGTNVGGSGFSVGSGAMLPPKKGAPIGRAELGSPFDAMNRGRETDAVLAQIQDALKAGHAPNSGVPLIGRASPGPTPSTDEVLAAIESALKLTK